MKYIESKIKELRAKIKHLSNTRKKLVLFKEYIEIRTPEDLKIKEIILENDIHHSRLKK